MFERQIKYAAISSLALMCLTLATITAQPVRAENQPRMERAIVLLIEAREQLQKASRDKGGHRVKAINQINRAIAEVRKGIHFDNRN